jgi:hypothetical protein
VKSQNPINDYVVNLHIYIRIIATRAGKKLRKKSKTNLPAFDAINAAALQQQAD